jgi:hypothetical protein
VGCVPLSFLFWGIVVDNIVVGRSGTTEVEARSPTTSWSPATTPTPGLFVVWQHDEDVSRKPAEPDRGRARRLLLRPLRPVGEGGRCGLVRSRR